MSDDRTIKVSLFPAVIVIVNVCLSREGNFSGIKLKNISFKFNALYEQQVNFLLPFLEDYRCPVANSLFL